jgi:diguanylate cyclase (GGDEF)-like protein
MRRLIKPQNSWFWFVIFNTIIVTIMVLIDILFLYPKNQPYFDNSGTITERSLVARSRDYLYKNLEHVSTVPLTSTSISEAEQFLDLSYALFNIAPYLRRYNCTSESLNNIDILTQQLHAQPFNLHQYIQTTLPVIECAELIQNDQDRMRTEYAINMFDNINLQRKLLFLGGLLILGIGIIFKLFYSKHNKLLTTNRNETHKWIHNAMQDALMDVPNRRAFNNDLPQYIKKYTEKGTPFSLLMCDIDYFKQYNDNLGHVAGDKALQQIAFIIKQALRDNDKLYRYGGEELIIILDDIPSKQASTIGMRVLELILENKLPHPTSEFGCITISIGCTTISESLKNDQELIEEADNCLYLAKQNGRNCLISSDDT